MSQENVELVRRAIAYFGETGELDEACYEADVIFRTRTDGPGHSTFQGIGGLRAAVQDFGDVWAISEFEPQEFIQVGDVVVVPLLFHLRAQSGVELDVNEAWAYWVSDGRIWRIEQHPSKQEAIEAAGAQG